MVEVVRQFDLHGHTRFCRPFSERTPYFPKDVIEQVNQIKFDGVAITGHNTIEGLKETLDFASQTGVILVPGMEITAFNGRTPHILALGLDLDHIVASRSPIPFGRKPERVIKWIHEYGGLAIAAHPSSTPKLTSLSTYEVEHLSHLLDGIEVVTLEEGKQQGLCDLAAKHHLAKLGGSDFHSLRQIGLAWTSIYEDVKTWQDVIEAIRQRKSDAFVQENIPPELARERSRNRMMQTLLMLGKK